MFECIPCSACHMPSIYLKIVRTAIKYATLFNCQWPSWLFSQTCCQITTLTVAPILDCLSMSNTSLDLLASIFCYKQNPAAPPIAHCKSDLWKLGGSEVHTIRDCGNQQHLLLPMLHNYFLKGPIFKYRQNKCWYAKGQAGRVGGNTATSISRKIYTSITISSSILQG